MCILLHSAGMLTSKLVLLPPQFVCTCRACRAILTAAQSTADIMYGARVVLLLPTLPALLLIGPPNSLLDAVGCIAGLGGGPACLHIHAHCLGIA